MPFYIVKSPNDYYEAIAYSTSRKAARTSTGVIWCCYAGPDGGGIHQIYASYSTDNGITWVEETITNAARDQDYPSMAIDSLNNVHIVWEGSPAVGKDEIYYRKRTAGVWGDIEQVTNINNLQAAGAIAIDSANNIHVLWIGRGWGVNTTKYNVQYRQRTSGGVWQAQEGVTDIAEHQWCYSTSIAIDGSDVIHAAWEGCGWGVNTDINNLQYRQRIAGVWQAQESISDSNRWHHFPCLALDSIGNVHCIHYAEFNPGAAVWDIWYRERIAGVWQAPVQLTNMASTGWDQYQPSISVDKNNDLHVVWHGQGWGVNTTIFNIQYLRRTAGSWQSQVGLTDRAFDQYSPNLIWAHHPIGGEQPNVFDEYCFVFVGMDDPVNLRVEFYIMFPPRSDYFQEGPPYDLSALEAIRNVEMSAMGRYYVDELGRARYESRYARNK